MPNNIDELANLQRKLFAENFFDVLDSLPTQETKIMLPQLSTVTNNLELIPFLKMLGMVSAFHAKRDPRPKSNVTLTKVHDSNVTSTSDVYVRSVTQNAFFSTSYTSLNSIGTIGTKYGEWLRGEIIIIVYLHHHNILTNLHFTDEAISLNRSRIRRKREALVKITFDKPFTFFIIHREFGLILTAGQISNPKVLPN